MLLAKLCPTIFWPPATLERGKGCGRKLVLNPLKELLYGLVFMIDIHVTFGEELLPFLRGESFHLSFLVLSHVRVDAITGQQCQHA